MHQTKCMASQSAGDAIAYNIIRAFRRKVTMDDEVTEDELIKHVGVTWINKKKLFVIYAPPVITIFILSLQGRSLEVTTQDGVVYTLKAKNYDGPTTARSGYLFWCDPALGGPGRYSILLLQYFTCVLHLYAFV